MKYLFLAFAGVMLLSLPASAQVQCKKALPLYLKNPYKIKAVNGVSSSTARVADYVEFQIMEDVYSQFKADDVSAPTEKDPTAKKDLLPIVLIPKSSSIFGVVLRREHRHFPVIQGHLEVILEPLKTWDGSLVKVSIARHPHLKEETSKQERNNNAPCKLATENCVAGRTNRSVAPVVPAIATAGTGAIAALSKNDTTRAIAATALLSIVAQKDISELISGTDADIMKDEIFDMTITPTDLCPQVKDATPAGKVPPPTIN